LAQRRELSDRPLEPVLGGNDNRNSRAILLDCKDPVSRLENGNIDVLEPIAIQYLGEPSIGRVRDRLTFNCG